MVRPLHGISPNMIVAQRLVNLQLYNSIPIHQTLVDIFRMLSLSL